MVREVIVTGKLDVKDVMKFMFHHNYSRIGGAVTGVLGLVAIITSPVMFVMGDKVSGFIWALIAAMASYGMSLKGPVFKVTSYFGLTVSYSTFSSAAIKRTL